MIVQFAPTATAAPETQVPPVIENVPPVPTLVIFGAALRTSSVVAVAGLVTVMVPVLVVVLAGVVVNAGVGPENVTVARVASVPFKVEVCVPAKSVTEMVAGFVPNACVVSGLNCTSMVQVAPGARVVVATT